MALPTSLTAPGLVAGVGAGTPIAPMGPVPGMATGAAPGLKTQTINTNPGGFTSDTQPSRTEAPIVTPEQQQYMQNALKQAPGLYNILAQLLGQPAAKSQFDFAPIAQQARTNFQTQTVPTLAERFGSLGGESRGSSAVIGQLGAAGAGLNEGLAALQQHYGLQQQAFNYGAEQDKLTQLMRLFSIISGQGLGQNFENIIDPGHSAGWKELLSQIVGASGKAAGAYFAGR
jgi:hypothetical protein